MKNRPNILYLPGFMVTDTKWYLPPNSSVSVSTATTHWGDDRKVWDYQTPGPGKRKFVDPTPGEYRVSEWRNPYGTRNYRSYWYGSLSLSQIQSGALDPAGMGTRARTHLSPAYSNAVYNMALEKFYDNVRQSEVNLAVMIGEARETGRMLQVGKSIFELLTMARRAKRAALMNPSKTLASIWLSYQYGWRPLLGEIYGYLKWSYDLFNEGVPIRGRAAIQSSVNSVSAHNGDPKGSRLFGNTWEKCEVKCWAGITDSTSYNLSRITSMDPRLIAWELVPLSFVVDWFYDVGGYLQMMEASAATNMAFKKGYITEVYRFSLTEEVHSYKYLPPSGGSSSEEWIDFNAWARTAWKRRWVLSAFPRPRAPSLRVKMGWQRIASAASLIRMILLGKVSGKRF